MTVDELCTRFAAESFPHLAPATRYQRALVYRQFCAEFGTLQVHALTPDRLRTWRDQLTARYAPGTIRLKLDIISGLLTAAVEEYEILANNPLLRVRKPKASHGRERFLSQEECARVLTACQHSRSAALYPLVVLAIATGCRKNELRTLRWRDVDLVRGALRLARTKNGERRAVPLASVALEVLRAWHGRSEGTAVWVFPSKDGHRPGNVSKAWYTARCKAGLPDFRFHDLRHTAASYLAMSGASLVEVAHILGHKTLRMVQRYSHFTDEHTRRTVEHMSHQFLPPPETQPDSDV